MSEQSLPRVQLVVDTFDIPVVVPFVMPFVIPTLFSPIVVPVPVPVVVPLSIQVPRFVAEPSEPEVTNADEATAGVAGVGHVLPDVALDALPDGLTTAAETVARVMESVTPLEPPAGVVEVAAPPEAPEDLTLAEVTAMQEAPPIVEDESAKTTAVLELPPEETVAPEAVPPVEDSPSVSPEEPARTVEETQDA